MRNKLTISSRSLLYDRIMLMKCLFSVEAVGMEMMGILFSDQIMCTCASLAQYWSATVY
jgi:hypothetical protein